MWWQGAVVYQIWPRSFNDSSGDGVGDLEGIIDRLDYLNDGRGGGLGIDAIWLSPIFLSPLVDFGYDVSSYTEIDPAFGDLETFDRLVAESHTRGMRVMLDWVPNHTSDQHPWFIESRSSHSSAKRDWYVWADPGEDGSPPNDWVSAFPAAGSAWTYDAATSQFYLHSYTASQPDLNWDNPQVQEAMLDTMRFWFDRGVDGFRIDVVHRLGKDPELGDNDLSMYEPEPLRPGRHDADWPTVHQRIRQVRSASEEYADRLLVGEVYILNQARLVDYLVGGDQLHLAHNFVFLGQPWSAVSFGETIEEFERMADGIEPSWCLNNHDHMRVRSRFDDDGLGEIRARALAVLLLALRGTIFLFQGEELGLPETELDSDARVDVDGRDGTRTPIPWEPPSLAGSGAGFTTGTPWLPVGANAEELNAAVQLNSDGSILRLYQSLLRLRRSIPALRKGSFSAVELTDDVFAFERRSGDHQVFVIVNFSVDPTPMVGSLVELSGCRFLASSVPESVTALGDLLPLEARWIERNSTQSS